MQPVVDSPDSTVIASHESHSIWSTVTEAIRGSSQDFTEAPVARAVVLLAVPMVLEMMMESVFAVTDIFVRASPCRTLGLPCACGQGSCVPIGALPQQEWQMSSVFSDVPAQSTTLRKLDPKFRQSKACSPNRAASSTQTSMPRALLPRASSRGEYVAMPTCRFTTAITPPLTPLLAGTPTR